MVFERGKRYAATMAFVVSARFRVVLVSGCSVRGENVAYRQLGDVLQTRAEFEATVKNELK